MGAVDKHSPGLRPTDRSSRKKINLPVLWGTLCQRSKMVLPQVNLSAKEPLENVVLSDEPLPGKDGTLEFPAIVTATPAPRVTTRQRRPCNRTRRIVTTVSLLVMVAVVATVGMMMAKHMRHRRKHMHCKYGRHNLPEHVTVDHDNQLIHVKHEQDQQNALPTMEVLHEYNRRMVAYKNVDKKVCYIDRLDETFSQGYERWEAYENKARDEKTMRVISKVPIEQIVVKHVLDVHIEEHCRDATHFWVMEINEQEITQDMEIVRF